MIVTPDMPFHDYDTVENSGQLIVAADVINGEEHGKMGIKILNYDEGRRYSSYRSFADRGEVDILVDSMGGSSQIHFVVTAEEAQFLADTLAAKAQAAKAQV